MRKSVVVAFLAAIATAVAIAADVRADQLWSVHNGQTIITLDMDALRNLGLRVEGPDPLNYPAADGQIVIPATPDGVEFLLTGNNSTSVSPSFVNGYIHHGDGLTIVGPAGKVLVDDLVIGANFNLATPGGDRLSQFITQPTTVVYEPNANTLAIECEEVKISAALARALRVPNAAGASIGKCETLVYMAWAGGDPRANPEDDVPVPHDCTNPTIGPDVIVGDLNGISNYAAVGGMDAISLGTSSCNIGNAQLLWQSGNVNHPVIPQSMYRLKTVSGSTRFEQIGQSWMKHAFTALSQNICCTCGAGGGVTLGIGCSDPYTSGRNGTQNTTTGGCGPKFEVDAHAGAITFPYTFRGVNLPDNSITRRCQVLENDLDPLQNTGALYFGESQYVTPDDAAARNQNNNCSYRPITISGTLAAHSLAGALGGATVRTKPAIQAWKDTDATVTETLIDTAEAIPAGQPTNTTGRCILSAKATSLGGGIYHYEYALFNMNSDRGVSVFTVPTTGVTVTNTGFHDVPYHSGDGFGTAIGALKNIDGTDWPVTVGATSVHWDVVPIVAPSDPRNTNYLRWGTMYNFRFDCNTAPTTGNVTLNYWKAVAGQPTSINVSTVIPSTGVCDTPVINAIAGQNASCGSAFTSSTPTAAGTGPFTWSITSGGQPGMTIAPTTGVVSWPNPVASGSAYNVTLQAASACSASVDTEVMAISVPFATTPAIDPVAPQNATCGAAFTSATPTGTGLAGATWSITLGGQPGMTINSSGVISWPSPVPNAAPYNVTIQATNACAAVPSDSKVVSISVPFAADPVIDPVPPQNGVCGFGFTSATPTGTGLTGATWSITAGGQPGMGITSAGVIGWPLPVASANPYNVTIQAANACSANPATIVVSITIPFGPTPSITPIVPTATVCSWAYTSAFPIASGGTPPYTWSLVGGPVGMTINSSNGQISWPVPLVSPTPYNATVQVTDGCAAGFGSTAFVLTVRLGDFDGDGLSNFNDVPYFIDHLLGMDTSTPCAGDMNGDTFLDGLDIQGFVSQL